MEFGCQSESEVVFEDSGCAFLNNGSFDNDEYNNNAGEIGCEVDDEISDNGEDSECDEEFDTSSGDGNEPRDCDAERISINCTADIFKIDMNSISADKVERYDFADLEIAYQFYYWYGRATGFSVRKSRVVRDHAGEILQKTFLCSREGFRENRGLTQEHRKREPKNETRCGCEAKFRVHIDIVTRRWYVTIFEFDHNHELLDGVMCGMLPAHRKMTKTDVQDIESHGNVGIRPYQMYGAMANSAGGFHKVGFVKKDLYNQVSKQRKLITSDASAAMKYLRDLGKKDQLMFVSHSVDKDNRLERLFWCDGESRMNFEVFGDVLAFDATYRKNKYNCPFVVFSGVNHHNQTIVFATGLVTRETEETYVWLLEQFVCAMKGKTPISVITDGDIAMKNAIRKVFPKAHHRLCAWHLLRNASTNVGIIPDFMRYLKRCMLGDIEINKFEELWGEMVHKFDLEDNAWIKEMYEKRKMWSTAHIRGFFFAGLRTTSRCEALHSHLRQFVHSRINLFDFVQQFQRCITYFRSREVEADFQSNYGQPVLQSSLRCIEKSAANQYTKEIFNMFRVVLKKCMMLKVLESHEMSGSCIYKVSKYCGKGEVWYVTHSEYAVEKFKCSCLRMESIGLPCDHIVCVLVFLDIDELPKCLVLPRWTKFAKESISGSYPGGSLYWDSQVAARYSSLVKMSKDVAELVYNDLEEYNRVVDVLDTELKRLKSKQQTNNSNVGRLDSCSDILGDVSVLDPPPVRTKGCGSNPTPTPVNRRRGPTCGKCGTVGHNKRFCQNSNIVVPPAVTPTSNYDNLTSERDTSCRDVDLSAV